jgi:4-hydroxybutyrate CoA-transferase
MKWEKIFQQKLVSAEEAISHIKSGNRVVAGHAAGTPELLLKTMVDHREQYRNVETYDD